MAALNVLGRIGPSSLKFRLTLLREVVPHRNPQIWVGAKTKRTNAQGKRSLNINYLRNWLREITRSSTLNQLGSQQQSERYCIFVRSLNVWIVHLSITRERVNVYLLLVAGEPAVINIASCVALQTCLMGDPNMNMFLDSSEATSGPAKARNGFSSVCRLGMTYSGFIRLLQSRCLCLGVTFYNFYQCLWFVHQCALVHFPRLQHTEQA